MVLPRCICIVRLHQHKDHMDERGGYISAHGHELMKKPEVDIARLTFSSLSQVDVIEREIYCGKR